MNFYVPTIGDKIYLEDSWHFALHPERRNESLAQRMIGLPKYPSWSSRHKMGEEEYNKMRNAYTEAHRNWYSAGATYRWLPRGTCLAIDRIYIKKGAPDYDSITFRIISCPEKKMEKARFWVKLRDANKIVCSLYPIHDTDARGRLDKHNRFSNLDLE